MSLPRYLCNVVDTAYALAAGEISSMSINSRKLGYLVRLGAILKAKPEQDTYRSAHEAVRYAYDFMTPAQREQRDAEPRESGIYFLLKHDRVVYVGQSVNMRVRIRTHADEGKKDFDSTFRLSKPVEELNEWEAYYILRFTPEYNRAFPANQQFYRVESVVTYHGKTYARVPKRAETGLAANAQGV